MKRIGCLIIIVVLIMSCVCILTLPHGPPPPQPPNRSHNVLACGVTPTPSHFAYLPYICGDREPQPVCDCSYDRYNCSDFRFQYLAQACFNYCWWGGYGDVHNLDADNDGIACESLPQPTSTPTITCTPTPRPTLTSTSTPTISIP